jgi:negative regulator of flagellin synthesis FlgM
MKISGDKPYVLQAYIKRTGNQERATQEKKSEKPSSGPDKVEISAKAREKEFGKIKGILEKVPEVREEKVAALKTAIEEGTYHVKGEEIAKRMIKDGIDEFV